jgi:hypothetical protein
MVEHDTPILAQNDMYTVYGGPDGRVSIDMRGFDGEPLRLRSELLQDKFRRAQTDEEIHQEVILSVLVMLQRKYGPMKAVKMMMPWVRAHTDITDIM